MNEYTATVASFRTALLRHALDAAGGNRTHAARALGLTRSYLCRLIRRHGLGRRRTPQGVLHAQV